ncbi:GIY-YIG nuclease family protein [Streptomyces sp. NPDC096153]|uniref:GIY-YIG nuclease family protein n=1 Tax=Streptomyces sp. NPDC096153 TaxID=3155548 RepID=UPI003318AF5A
MNPLIQWATTHPWPAAAAAAGILLALAGTVWAAARSLRGVERPPAAVVMAAIAAAACTAYSADTSWAYARDSLKMTSTTERAWMFAAAEVALFATAMMARQNLRSKGSPGTPGVLVWVITGVQVIPAYTGSGFWGGTVRAFVGPILAALLWHLAMGIELRHSRPGADSQSLPAILVRELRERLLSRLGLSVRDRTAEQISRDRAMARAVRLASRAGLRGWGRRRLAAAVARAHVGTDEAQRHRLLQELAARRGAAELSGIPLSSPWIAAEEDGDALNKARAEGRTDAAVTALLSAVGAPEANPSKPRRPQPPSAPSGPVGEAVEDVQALYGSAHAPIVYFLRNGNRVKIGTSQNLKRRVAALSLRPDDVVRVEHGDQQHERSLHRRFVELRTGDTEWFDLRGDLARYLGEPVEPEAEPDEPAPEPSEPEACVAAEPVAQADELRPVEPVLALASAQAMACEPEAPTSGQEGSAFGFSAHLTAQSAQRAEGIAKVAELVAQDPGITSGQVAELLSVSPATAKRYLREARLGRP